MIRPFPLSDGRRKIDKKDGAFADFGLYADQTSVILDD
jgi:hypothetical protein